MVQWFVYAGRGDVFWTPGVSLGLGTGVLTMLVMVATMCMILVSVLRDRVQRVLGAINAESQVADRGPRRDRGARDRTLSPNATVPLVGNENDDSSDYGDEAPAAAAAASDDEGFLDAVRATPLDLAAAIAITPRPDANDP